jgi:peptidoglycan hydrolase-like protein with peptidoglycan-binding domain
MSDTTEPMQVEETEEVVVKADAADVADDVADVTDAAVAEEPEPAPAPAKPKATAVASHVVSGNEYDEVHLKQCVFKNPYARKSLTVHHVQRRLVELGYDEAAADRDGWYGDITLAAVAKFQKDKKIEGTGVMNAKTLAALFNGDPNVKVVVE